MKIIYAFCIVLALVADGCSGKKEIKPSEDSLKSKEAMELINAIETAYREKNGELLSQRIHPVIAKNILNELSFESVELSFTPWVVRIKESSTIINADWQGTWHYSDGEVTRRGIVNFVFIDSPMQLVHINGDNPFYTRSADYEPETGDLQGETAVEPESGEVQSEKPEEPEETPTVEIDKKIIQPHVRPDQGTASAQQQAPETEQEEKGDETSELQPLKRTKMLYREHDLIPEEPSKVTAENAQRRYIVQVGAWKNVRYAQTALELVQGYYPEALIVDEGGLHKIRIKKMMTRQEGMLAIEDLEDKFNLRPILIGLDAQSQDSGSVMPPVTEDLHNFFVQIGVWRNRTFAETALADLQRNYPEAVMIKTTKFHKVGIPVSMSREKAHALIRELKETLNLDPILVEK